MPNYSVSRNLKIWFSGFLSARVGDWVYLVALNWAVLTLTESAWFLALINACRLAPTLLFSVPSGLLADRLDRRSFLAGLYIGVAALTLLIGVSLLYQLPFWLCALLVVLRACLMAMEPPARNAMVSDLESGLQFSRAVAWNASTMNLGRVIGPAVAGVLVAYLNPLLPFVLATLLVAAYPCLLFLVDYSPRTERKKRAKAPLAEAVAYLKEEPQTRRLLLLAVAPMLFGFPYIAMLPMITKELLGLGADGFGGLLAISAAGALLASSWLGAQPQRYCSGRSMVAGLFAFSASLVWLTIAPSALAAAVLLLLVGFSSQWYRTGSRVLLQSRVPAELQGRIVSLALLDRGLIPAGTILVGAVATWWGPLLGSLVMGVGCGVGTLLAVLWCPSILDLRIQATADATARAAKKPARKAAAVAALLVAAGISSGCGSAQATPQPLQRPTVEVEHAWGKTSVPVHPQRIVVLDLSFLDCLAALEKPPVGFAGTTSREVPAHLRGRAGTPMYLGERKQPNLELILSLEPDLIVANPQRHRLLRGQLERLAPTIALEDDSYEQVLGNLRLLARLTDSQAAAEATQLRLRQALSRTQERWGKNPSLLVAGAFEDEFTVWTADSFIGTLFASAGGHYIYRGSKMASESQSEVAKLTMEGLHRLNPDLLFVYGHCERWLQNPLFENLNAVRQSAFLEVDRDLWSRSRGPLAAELILQQALEAAPIDAGQCSAKL